MFFLLRSGDQPGNRTTRFNERMAIISNFVVSFAVLEGLVIVAPSLVLRRNTKRLSLGTFSLVANGVTNQYAARKEDIIKI